MMADVTEEDDEEKGEEEDDEDDESRADERNVVVYVTDVKIAPCDMCVRSFVRSFIRMGNINREVEKNEETERGFE